MVLYSLATSETARATPLWMMPVRKLTFSLRMRSRASRTPTSGFDWSSRDDELELSPEHASLAVDLLDGPSRGR